MLQLTEHELRLLSELEEFHERDIVPLINLAIERTSPDSELSAMRSSLMRLLDAGLITVELQTFPADGQNRNKKLDARAVLTDLDEWLAYGRFGDYWHYRNLDDVPHVRPNIVPTPKGLAEARRVLSTRGYQWWRPGR